MKITIDLSEIGDTDNLWDWSINLEDMLQKEVKEIIKRKIKRAVDSDDNLKEALKEIKRRTATTIVERLKKMAEGVADP